MLERIKTGWAKSSQDFAGKDTFWQRSAPGWLRLALLKRLLKKYSKGRLLDAGAGTLSCRYLAEPHCEEYVSVDFQRTHPELTLVADVERLPFSQRDFGTVLCVEVLEHVPHPQKAVAELFRVLQPGGHLIVTVPHYMYAHNEPYDYFRYTQYGLRLLLEEAGFEVVELLPSGGFLSFLHHLMATILVGISYEIPILGPVVFAFCQGTGWVVAWLDEHLDRKKLLALNYVAVARRQ